MRDGRPAEVRSYATGHLEAEAAVHAASRDAPFDWIGRCRPRLGTILEAIVRTGGIMGAVLRRSAGVIEGAADLCVMSYGCQLICSDKRRREASRCADPYTGSEASEDRLSV